MVGGQWSVVSGQSSACPPKLPRRRRMVSGQHDTTPHPGPLPMRCMRQFVRAWGEGGMGVVVGWVGHCGPHTAGPVTMHSQLEIPRWG